MMFGADFDAADRSRRSQFETTATAAAARAAARHAVDAAGRRGTGGGEAAAAFPSIRDSAGTGGGGGWQRIDLNAARRRRIRGAAESPEMKRARHVSAVIKTTELAEKLTVDELNAKFAADPQHRVVVTTTHGVTRRRPVPRGAAFSDAGGSGGQGYETIGDLEQKEAAAAVEAEARRGGAWQAERDMLFAALAMPRLRAGRKQPEPALPAIPSAVAAAVALHARAALQ